MNILLSRRLATHLSVHRTARSHVSLRAQFTTEKPKAEPFDPKHLKYVYDELTLHKYINNPTHQKIEPCEPRFGITKDIFLQKIGKDCGKYMDKFTDWQDLMTTKTRELRNRGIPTQQRRWILRWVEKYKQGVEPYAIPFKSKAKKHKLLRAERKAAHDALMAKRAEMRKAMEEEQAKEDEREKERLEKLTTQQLGFEDPSQQTQEETTEEQKKEKEKEGKEEGEQEERTQEK